MTSPIETVPKFNAVPDTQWPDDAVSPGQVLGGWLVEQGAELIHVILTPAMWEGYKDAVGEDPEYPVPDAVVFNGFLPSDVPGVQPVRVVIKPETPEHPAGTVYQSIHHPEPTKATHPPHVTLQ